MTHTSDLPSHGQDLGAVAEVGTSTVADPPGRDGLASIDIALGLLPGQDRITVNGQDCSRDVVRLAVHRGDSWPIVVLEHRTGAATITGPGVVQILPGEGDQPATLGTAVADWLDEQDAGDLEQVALAGGGMGGSPIAAVLAELRRRARLEAGR